MISDLQLEFCFLDTRPRPEYPNMMRGWVDSEPEAGDSMPRKKGIPHPFCLVQEEVFHAQVRRSLQSIGFLAVP